MAFTKLKGVKTWWDHCICLPAKVSFKLAIRSFWQSAAKAAQRLAQASCPIIYPALQTGWVVHAWALAWHSYTTIITQADCIETSSWVSTKAPADFIRDFSSIRKQFPILNNIQNKFLKESIAEITPTLHQHTYNEIFHRPREFGV